MSADLRHIVVADLNRHYTGRDYSEEYAVNLVDQLQKMGQVFEAPNVLIRFRKLDDETVEFHCMNAGSGADLTNAINSLLKSLPKQFTRAVTYYDNPRINELSKYSYFSTVVAKINGGTDRTYEMSFDLRGK